MNTVEGTSLTITSHVSWLYIFIYVVKYNLISSINIYKPSSYISTVSSLGSGVGVVSLSELLLSSNVGLHRRKFAQDGKGLLGMGSRPAARGRKEREFHRIVSPCGVTQLDST